MSRGRLTWAVGTLRGRVPARLRRLRNRLGSVPVTAPIVPRPPAPRRYARRMRLTHVLASSDLNPRYLDCWPLTSQAWRAVTGLEPVLVLLADPEAVPSELAQDANVYVFEPLPDIHISLQAQCIRLLYPALLEAEGAVMISDVDIMPLEPTYFHGVAGRIGAGDFLAYRDILLYGGEIPVCYNAALPQTWAEIFEIGSVDDVRATLRRWGEGLRYDGVAGGWGWDTDQVKLFETLVPRGRRLRDVWVLDDRYNGMHRLDGRIIRGGAPDERMRRRILRGAYTDYHLIQPLAEFRATNEGVLELALEAARCGSR